MPASANADAAAASWTIQLRTQKRPSLARLSHPLWPAVVFQPNFLPGVTPSGPQLNMTFCLWFAVSCHPSAAILFNFATR